MTDVSHRRESATTGLAAVCPTCRSGLRQAADDRVGEHLLCRACGGVFPIEFGVPNLIDVRTVAALGENLLAVWYITQQESLPLYREQRPDSCSDPERRDVRAFREFMDLSGKLVLDIGSGSFAVPGYVDVAEVGGFVGIDPIGPEADPPFDFRTALAEFLPFADDTFDAVILATSLDHVLDLDRTLAEIRRVLRPDGRCYFWGTLGYQAARQHASIPSVSEPPSREVRATDHDIAIDAFLAARQRVAERTAKIDSADHDWGALLHDRFHFRHLDRGMLGNFALAGLGPVRETQVAETDVDEVVFIEFSGGHGAVMLGHVFGRLDERLHRQRELATSALTRVAAVEEAATATTAELDELRADRNELRAEVSSLRNEIAALRRRDGVGEFLRRVKTRIDAVLLTPKKVVHLIGLAAQAVFFPGKRSKTATRGKRVLMITVSQIDIDSRINKEAATLADAGYEVEIVCHQAGHYEEDVFEEEIRPGIRYLRVRPDLSWAGKAFGFLYQESFRVAGLRREYDYVHAHDLTSLFVGWVLARRRGVPLVYDAHEIWTDNVEFDGREWVTMRPMRRFWLRKFEGFVVRYCDLFITVSPSIQKEFTRRYRLAEPPLLLANFPDAALAERVDERTPSIRELCDLTDEHFVTLYLGGVNPLRNIETVIRAHAHLPERFVFVIRGPGVSIYQAEYEALARECGVAGRVRYLPAVGRDDVIAGAKGADCGIVMLKNMCPNFYWFYPNKFFEYMLAALPVAVSDFPDVRAHIDRELCGVVFDPESPESIAAALQRLADDPDEARAMGQRGLEGIRTRYNWTKATEGLIRGYQRLDSK